MIGTLFQRVVFSLFTCFVLSVSVFPSSSFAASKTASYASLSYDVVYVRCPRGREPVVRNGTESLLNWNGANDIWLSASNNVYQEPGCDLVLHHSDAGYGGGLPLGDPGREEVLVDCDETNSSQAICSIADPNVSFDGRYIVYSKFTDTRSFISDTGWLGRDAVGSQSFLRMYPDGNGPNNRYASQVFSGLKPYAAPALIYIYDLVTQTETRVSPQETHFAGRAYPNKSTEWAGNIPVMDTGPYFLPDGRIGFTSNRDSNGIYFQLFAMNRDGKSLELLGHRALRDQLHPMILKDGRIGYTSDDVFLQKVGNNQFSLFTINPDGSDPFIFAGKGDATAFSYHYMTQLSDGDIITTLYYNHNNSGLGSLLRFPVDPPGPNFQHLWRPLTDSSPMPALDGKVWYKGNKVIPFGRPGQFLLTPEATAGDTHNSPYESTSEYWNHPYDGREVYMRGKFTHPAAAPDNDLLVTYCIGGCSQQPHTAFSQSLDATMKVIGKDAGIWLLPLEPHSTRTIGNIADDGLIVVDQPNYHEIMPRAVVSYEQIYGMATPVNKTPTANTGNQDPRLAAGEPFALTGAASLYDRETRAINGTPWNMADGGGTMAGRTYLNIAASGSDLAIYDNSEVAGIRVLMPIPDHANQIYTNTEMWAGRQRHHLRILGEFPVRKPDSGGNEPVDAQGNPDTSFVVKLPADTPFLFQTIDKNGMALDIETASRSAYRGEQQFCGGCHVHTREGMDPFQSVAKLDTTAPFADFSGDSAPLLSGLDGNGFAVSKPAVDVYDETMAPGVTSRRSFAVDWRNGISDIIQNRCASCHGKGQSAMVQTGLRLDGDDRTYELLIKNQYIDEGGARIDANTSSSDRITPRYQCCTVSRWMSMNSARSSMLVWALYGERLDGRNPSTGLPWGATGEAIPADVKEGLLNVPVDNVGSEHPETWAKVAEHAAYVADMPEAEKRLITRWIDIGAPKLNVQDDLMRPVLTVTPVLQGNTVSAIQVGLWDDSPIDYSKFKVAVNGTDITPTVSGSPQMVMVDLGGMSVTDANADTLNFTFEVWDKPDRHLDYDNPSAVAANRTEKEYTGRDLLRMVSVAANTAPTSASAEITTIMNVASEPVLASVVDPDVGDTHVISIVSQPSNGSAEVVNNRLVYTPDTNFVGSDSFTFKAQDLGGLSVTGTASVTVEPPPNRAPTSSTATIVTTVGVTSDPVTPVVTDPDEGDTHTFSIVTQPANGAAKVVNNRLVYTPDSGFVGADSFSFEAMDAGGLSVIGTANVTVEPPPNRAPTSTSATIETLEGASNNPLTPEVSDPDVGDVHTFSIASQPANGTASVVNNRLVYTPNNGFVGIDSFTFTATDSGGLSVTGTANVVVYSSGSGGGGTGGSGGGGTIDDGFDDGTADNWAPYTQGRWEVALDEGDNAYYLNTTDFESQSGDRLGEYALLTGQYDDFEMTLQAKLGDDVAGNAQADYAIVLGYQDDNNYYYMMFNNDQAYSQLFKVENGVRVTVAATASDLVNDNAYHAIGVRRENSKITVTYDGAMILSVVDSTFGAGQVGVGSLNDSAYFDDIIVKALATDPNGGGPTGEATPAGGSMGPFFGLALLSMLYMRRRRPRL